ncbi:MAG: hypothetical protein V4608_12530 [Bacteroidota bacterium]
MNLHNNYDINTGVIFLEFTYNLEDHPASLLHEMTERLEFILVAHKIIPTRFHPDGDGITHVQYKTNITLSCGETSFDFFFALKLLLTDVMKIRELLIYQKRMNFNDGLDNYVEFLEDLLIKYREILTDNKIDMIVNKFIINIKKESNKNLNQIDNSIHKATQDFENPHPSIFKNGYAYQMFIELKELTVKQNTVVADYSFIFHNMKAKPINAINSTVTEPAFIEFLNTNFQTDISVLKLPFRNPAHKKPIYTSIVNKYLTNP